MIDHILNNSQYLFLFSSSSETEPVFCFLGQTCNHNAGEVTSLEVMTVSVDRKIREKWQQNGEKHETDKSWHNQRGLNNPTCFDLQHNQEDNRDNTATNMWSKNSVTDSASACSRTKSTNLKDQANQLSSTHL